jgi:ribosomal protection tetracycline resistance protein
VQSLNLGILAHVDAGKTTLTERLLHDAGVIAELGSVDDGNTQTDTLALERRRGITIKSAVVSFAIGDLAVNLIDTPGHPDFIAEVERVLSVLDGAVLVVSAVECVQAQTRVLMRALQRLRIPTLIFVNKIDRRGADAGRVLRAIADKLTPAAVPMTAADRAGTRGATAVPYAAGDAAFAGRAAGVLADHDDALLADCVDDPAAVTAARLRRELAAQTARAVAHPLYLGSAITGAGVDHLTAGIRSFLPAAGGAADAPVSGSVFKVERGPAGEKIALVRLFAGTVRTRDRVRLGGRGEAKVTAIGVFDEGGAVRRDAVEAGRIARLWGLADARIGDAVSGANGDGGSRRAAGSVHHFAPPTLETVVVPAGGADRGALRVALDQLAEQDPLIGLRQDDVRRELSLSLYGEVQKEVIQATLADDFGVEVTFRPSTTICVERVVGTGAAFELIGADDNPFLATVGLRVEPAPPGAGVAFGLEVELGSMPAAFFTAVEETVRATLGQGLHGWEVPDCRIAMTHSGYWARQSHSHATFDKSMSSTARDFRQLTPLVLMAALRRAGTCVHEPLHRFRLDAPADVLGPVSALLARMRATPGAPAIRGAACVIEGEVPAARVHELQQHLPALTRGEAVLESEFARYEPVRGPVPERPRLGLDPLDRKEYVLRQVRRVPA